ncbi:MAG: flagellar assembly protein A [Clostridia bacterium]
MPADDVLVRGGTVEEAVEKASRVLQASPSEVEYEVVRNTDGGQFDSGKHEVLLRAWRTGKVGGNETTQGTGHGPQCGGGDQDGTVEVKGGRIVIRDPRGCGKPATIVPVPGIAIRVNGDELVEPRTVTGRDSVTIEAEARETAQAAVEVTIGRDRLTAEVRITPRKIARPVVVDQEPQTVFRPVILVEEVSEKTITVEDVQAALESRGVVVGICAQAVEEAVLAADGLGRVVAKGIPPLEGKDGFVEHLVELEPVPVVWEEGESRVDYWERYRFPFVRAGEVLSVLHPPIRGTPGRAVTGETIPPREVREAVLRAGEGAELCGDGTKVVASRDGKPVAYGTSYTCVEVVPVMVHEGDVGLASGHLRFVGDIVVRGDVLEGARVEASGGVTVLGYAAGATIRAGGAVKVKGSVVNSHVRAGGVAGLASRLRPVLETIDHMLARWESAVQASPDHDGMQAGARGQLSELGRLSGSRLRELDRLAASVREVLDEAGIELPAEIVDAAGSLAKIAKRVSASGSMDAPGPDEVSALRAGAETVTGWIERSSSAGGGIVVGYAQNSVLESGEDILVAEKGCYNCSLHAAEGVRVKGNVRGGELYAARRVQVGSVGTPGQWPCSSVIRVQAGGQIRAGVVYPGTTVQVGGESFVFESTRFDVKAYLDDQGTLVIR